MCVCVCGYKCVCVMCVCICTYCVCECVWSVYVCVCVCMCVCVAHEWYIHLAVCNGSVRLTINTANMDSTYEAKASYATPSSPCKHHTPRPAPPASIIRHAQPPCKHHTPRPAPPASIIRHAQLPLQASYATPSSPCMHHTPRPAPPASIIRHAHLPLQAWYTGASQFPSSTAKLSLILLCAEKKLDSRAWERGWACDSRAQVSAYSSDKQQPHRCTGLTPTVHVCRSLPHLVSTLANPDKRILANPE